MTAVPGFQYYEGLSNELFLFMQQFNGANGSLHLSVSSALPKPGDSWPAPYAEPADVAYNPILGGLLDINVSFSAGNATMTISGALFNFQGSHAPPQTVTGWWIESDGGEYLVYGGAVSPTYTIPVGFDTSFSPSPITIVLGPCSTSPPPPPSGRLWNTDPDNWEAASYTWETA